MSIKSEAIAWVKDYFAKNGNSETKAVIGISGGKDSSTVAALCCAALGKDRVIGVMMPNGVQSDIEDSKKIEQYGYSKETYDGIDLPDNMEVQKKSAEEINQSISENDMIRNSLVRYAYIAKKKYNKDVPDNKLEAAIRKFKGTSYKEIQQHLNKTLDGIKNKKKIPIIKESNNRSLGYTTAMSLSLIFIVFGFIVCILAIELYLFYHI
jgi:hypothetical protein